MRCLRVQGTQRGDAGDRLRAVGAGFDAGQEAAFLDQGFGLDRGGKGIHAKKLRASESKVRSTRL